MNKIKDVYIDYNSLEKKYFKKKNVKKINSELQFHKKKYKFYIKELSSQFNYLLGKDYSHNFWNVTIGTFIFYHLHQCQEVYNTFSTIKKLDRKKTLKILNPYFFNTPSNLYNYQKFIQSSDIGRLQIFSILIKKKFPKLKIIYDKKKYSHYNKKKNDTKKTKGIDLNFLFQRVINFFYRKIKNPSLLITGCYWNIKDNIDIQYKSNGKIRVENFYINNEDNINLDKKLRNEIFSSKKYTDSFDQFFFETLKYCCPKSLFENLDFRINRTENYLNKFKNIKYIINENLNEDNLILLAISRNKNINTIYCEHNTLSHPYVGDWTLFIKSLFDFYITLGWKNANKNFFAGGSLFPAFRPLKNYSESINKKILFVSSLPIKRTLFHSSIYGEDSFNNNSYYKINKLFFNNINQNVARKIIYKKYPNTSNFNLSCVENKIDKLVKIRTAKVIVNKNRITTEDLKNSKLVIVNYIKTFYLQTLISNIPTVIFYNNESYSLKSRHKNFFKELTDASIMHKNPQSAAKFVNVIYNDPYKWWNSKKTQEARKKFLLSNIKSGDELKKLVLKFANKK